MTNQTHKKPLLLREKLVTQGATQLSDAELLAVFISTGNGKRSCLQIGQEILNHLGDLRAVLNAPLQAFKSIAGIGLVRFTQLQALREICRRSDLIHLQKHTTLTHARDTHTFLKRQLRDRKNETFAALFLDNQHRVIAYEELFHGTINEASVYPRPIIQRALAHNAAAILFAHNHPSGISDAS